jgi:hypothetical protein
VPPHSVLASQLKSLYRHGHISRCSDKLDDFKFCLSTRTMHPDERREAWIRRRAEWWARRRLARSSEGVWEVRRCVLPALCFGLCLHIALTIPGRIESRWKIIPRLYLCGSRCCLGLPRLVNSWSANSGTRPDYGSGFDIDVCQSYNIFCRVVIRQQVGLRESLRPPECRSCYHPDVGQRRRDSILDAQTRQRFPETGWPERISASSRV